MNRLFVLLWILLPLCFSSTPFAYARTHISKFLPNRQAAVATLRYASWPLQDPFPARQNEKDKANTNETANFEKCVNVRKWAESGLSSPTDGPIAAFQWCCAWSGAKHSNFCDGGCLHVRGDWVLISFEFRRGFGKLHFWALCLVYKGCLHVWLEMELATFFITTYQKIAQSYFPYDCGGVIDRISILSCLCWCIVVMDHCVNRFHIFSSHDISIIAFNPYTY